MAEKYCATCNLWFEKCCACDLEATSNVSMPDPGLIHVLIADNLEVSSEAETQDKEG